MAWNSNNDIAEEDGTIIITITIIVIVVSMVERTAACTVVEIEAATETSSEGVPDRGMVDITTNTIGIPPTNTDTVKTHPAGNRTTKWRRR